MNKLPPVQSSPTLSFTYSSLQTQGSGLSRNLYSCSTEKGVPREPEPVSSTQILEGQACSSLLSASEVRSGTRRGGICPSSQHIEMSLCLTAPALETEGEHTMISFLWANWEGVCRCLLVMNDILVPHLCAVGIKAYNTEGRRERKKLGSLFCDPSPGNILGSLPFTQSLRHSESLGGLSRGNEMNLRSREERPKLVLN